MKYYILEPELSFSNFQVIKIGFGEPTTNANIVSEFKNMTAHLTPFGCIITLPNGRTITLDGRKEDIMQLLSLLNIKIYDTDTQV